MNNIQNETMETTKDLEEVWGRLDHSIRQMQESERALRRVIDARRLAARPEMPTRGQIESILEGLWRFKNPGVKPANSNHLVGDFIGHGVRFSRKGDIGWFHFDHGAPFEFRGHRGRKIWQFTPSEEQFLLNYIEEQGGVQVIKWWRSDGLSVDFRFLAPDEEPTTVPMLDRESK